MVAQGFDCSTPLSASLAKVFFSQHHVFVGRYLADITSWKRLSANEAKDISASGLYIISIFERYADRVKEGAPAGSEDGKLAVGWAQEVGQPKGTPIYFCVDYDASMNDIDAIEAYMRAAQAELDGYELGVYGSYSVIKELSARGLIARYWQTYAWSNGNKWEFNSLYQYKNDVTVNGIGIDFNISNGDAGGWQVGMEPQVKDFTDVPETYWAYGVISAAKRAGVMTGYSDGTFRPEQAITRAEVASIVNDLLFLINQK